MELIERINALEGEVKLVKSEIKKVLVDLRETMNSAENPFAYLEQFRRGLGGVDEERLGTMEEAMEKLKKKGGGNEVEEERIKNLEEALEQLKEMGGGDGIEEERIKNMEEAMEQLKEMGIDGEKLKKLEDSVQELKELGSVEVEKLQNLEGAIEKLAELETQLQPGKPLKHNPTAALESESELRGMGMGIGAGAGAGIENEIVDTVTLAQLIQWADTAVNLIGMAKLNQIVELYELTGRVSREMKDTILQVAELPDAILNPEKGHVETKHCITALCELDRILNGEHQELFALLKELCNSHSPLPLNLNLKNTDGKHASIPSNPQFSGHNPKTETGKGKKN
ncbi:MAG: hypothetical protein WBC40_01760 [Halobacteriota archaeon]